MGLACPMEGRSSGLPRASGDPPAPTRTPAEPAATPFETMDRATWNAMSTEERTAWLRQVATNRAEEQRLIAQGLRGSFDTLTALLRTRADVEIEEIRGRTRIAIARELGRDAAERELLDGMGGGGGGSSSRDTPTPQRIVPASSSSGAMVLGGAALLLLLAGRK